MSIKKSLRADNLPMHMKLPVWVYGKIGAGVLGIILRVNKRTCDWRQEGEQFSGSCIHAIWHENIPAFMTYYLPDYQRHHVWMQHPNVYMRPIHLTLKNLGVDRVYGSSGQGGQEALEELILRLRRHEKCGTMMAPDGPAGPVKVVKRGTLDLALATSLPIVPIRFEYTRTFRVGWDQKHWPLPWSTIKIIEGNPIYVSQETFKEDSDQLQKSLGR